MWYIYVKKGCGYSTEAIRLLNEKKQYFILTEVSDVNKQEIYENIDKYTNSYRLFPMVFNNQEFIGGYKELKKYFTEIDGNIIMPKGKSSIRTKFNGSPSDSLGAMIYLSNKHPNDCVVITKRYSEDIFKQSEISIRWSEKLNKLLVPENFWQSFNRCKNSSKRFIVYPFGFTCNNISHSNYLLYDRKTKTMERFEPHGNVNLVADEENIKCLNSPVDFEILKLFEKHMGTDFIKRYYKPLEYTPEIGYQTIQESEKEMKESDPEGFCSAWCVWYIDLRLSNPDIDRKELIELSIKELKKHPQSLTKFIRNYSNFLSKIKHDLR
jgi:glutaredoxin